MRLCLFEDSLVADLEPLSLTRPVFDLLCGCNTLADKHARHFSARYHGVLVRPSLVEIVQESSFGIAVNDLDWIKSGPVVLVNGRWLPPLAASSLMQPCVGLCDDEVAFAVLFPEHLAGFMPESIDAYLEEWKTTLPTLEAGGKMVHHLWDLVDHNADEIALDVQRTATARPRSESMPIVVGPMDRLFIDPSAHLDPVVVADTSAGPVVVDRDVVISAFTRLEGPCYIGPGTHVLGAKIRGGTSLGSHCRVGGEVERSILLGYANKYHDGFLGHAYVGAWVNLGAGTSNSDLRNDYGDVSVRVAGQFVDTGRSKVGCFLGDHTKTGLGTLLNTGTSAGLFCNLLPTGGLLPKFAPSFTSVWNGALREEDLEALLVTAARVMARRGKRLDPAHDRLYRLLWEQTAGERRLAIREAERRRLRMSA